jgi:hypothetical protein
VIDGRPLIDVHLHAARRDTVKPPWQQWLPPFAAPGIEELYRPDGTLDPAGSTTTWQPRGWTSRCCWPSTARR